MKKILVTGADGFIGSHLVEKLVRDGSLVKALVCYNSFNSYGWLDTLSPEIKKSVEVVMGDIRDLTCVKTVMQECTQVYHLAALISIPYSYRASQSYVDTNIKGTLNVVQSAVDLNIEKVIHTSTSEVYGTAQFVPITEEHPLQGQSPYSASKIGADQIAYSYYCSFDLPVSIIRPFNVYGPRQSARAIIPTIIIQLLSGSESLCLGALGPTRDFTLIEDTINGFVAAMRTERSIGEVINIGSNFEISIGDLANLIGTQMGCNPDITEDSSRLRPKNSEVNRLFASNKKALTLLDWKPKYSGTEGLKRGLDVTIEWFRKNYTLPYYKSYIYNI